MPNPNISFTAGFNQIEQRLKFSSLSPRMMTFHMSKRDVEEYTIHQLSKGRHLKLRIAGHLDKTSKKEDQVSYSINLHITGS
jgi:hypothetical protein